MSADTDTLDWSQPALRRYNTADTDETYKRSKYFLKQAVALAGRSRTGPPCSVTVELLLDCRRHGVIAWPTRVKPPSGSPWSVTDPDRQRRQTPASKNNTGPLGGPVINSKHSHQINSFVQQPSHHKTSAQHRTKISQL